MTRKQPASLKLSSRITLTQRRITLKDKDRNKKNRREKLPNKVDLRDPNKIKDPKKNNKALPTRIEIQ